MLKKLREIEVAAVTKMIKAAASNGLSGSLRESSGKYGCSEAQHMEIMCGV